MTCKLTHTPTLLTPYPQLPNMPYNSADGDQLILTKGDNNDADDIALYRGARWMRRSNVVGKVRG